MTQQREVLRLSKVQTFELCAFLLIKLFLMSIFFFLQQLTMAPNKTPSTHPAPKSNKNPSTRPAPTSNKKPPVKKSQINGRSVLQRAFAGLKNQVESLHQPIPHMPADLGKRWAWFVKMATERSVSAYIFFRIGSFWRYIFSLLPQIWHLAS